VPVKPSFLIGVAVVVGVSAFQLWISPGNPPGFMRDEAALAYNAYTIGHQGRDEDGARFPLYFRSFDDYKSPVFVYALAGVFRVTGPHKEVARGFAAVCVLAAVLLLGWLAFRRTGRALVGLVIVVLAGCSPWLFELGRVAYEVSMVPLFMCLALLGVEHASRTGRWKPVAALPVSAALGALTYAYAGGRVLAPLLAGALVAVLDRRRWRWVLTAWVGFGVTQIPLLVYTWAHPGALTRRFDATTFVTDDMSAGEVAGRAVVNYLQDLQVWHYVVSGDVKPYVHTPGAGALLGAFLVLAVAGLLLILVQRRSDPFWRFALAALAVSPVPAALTSDRFHAIRLVPLVVMLVVVAIPAVEFLVDASARATWPRVLAGCLAIAAVAQFVLFVDNFTRNGPLRSIPFEAGIPVMLDRVWADEGTVYIDYDDRAPQVLARWYALTEGVDESRVVRLSDGGVPPTGAIAFGRLQACDYVCERFLASGDYWLARMISPRPTDSGSSGG
jgi:4-amino-4-deoxy-L-arabinose transferase-like glycosyltransferase